MIGQDSISLRKRRDELRAKVSDAELRMLNPGLKAEDIVALGEEHAANNAELEVVEAALSKQFKEQRKRFSAAPPGVLKKKEVKLVETAKSKKAKEDASNIFRTLMMNLDEKARLTEKLNSADITVEEKTQFAREVIDKDEEIAGIYSEYIDAKLEMYGKDDISTTGALTRYRSHFFAALIPFYIVGVALLSALLVRITTSFATASAESSFVVSKTGYDVLKQVNYSVDGDSGGSWMSLQFSYTGVITKLRLGKEEIWTDKSFEKCHEDSGGEHCDLVKERMPDYPYEYSAISWESCDTTIYETNFDPSAVFASADADAIANRDDGDSSNSTTNSFSVYVNSTLLSRTFNPDYQYYLPGPGDKYGNREECDLAITCSDATTTTHWLIIGSLFTIVTSIMIHLLRFGLDSNLYQALHVILLVLTVLLVGSALSVYPSRCIEPWMKHIEVMTGDAGNPVFDMAHSEVIQWYPSYSECENKKQQKDDASGDYHWSCERRPSTLIWPWSAALAILCSLVILIPCTMFGEKESAIERRENALEEVVEIEIALYGGSDVFPEHDKTIRDSDPGETLEHALLRMHAHKLVRRRESQRRQSAALSPAGSRRASTNPLHGGTLDPIPQETEEGYGTL